MRYEIIIRKQQIPFTNKKLLSIECQKGARGGPKTQSLISGQCLPRS